MQKLDLNDLSTTPIYEHGKVSTALVRDEHFVISGEVGKPVRNVTVVIQFVDGTSESHEALLYDGGAFEAKIHVPTEDKVVLSISALAVEEERILSIKFLGDCHLDRIYNTSLEQINRNLRWAGRIEDFETRAYACLNTIRANTGIFNLTHYSVVACGYTAIELDRPDIIYKVSSASSNTTNTADISNENVSDVMSYAMYQIHLAVFYQDTDLLDKIYGIVLPCLDRIREDSMSPFNAIRAVAILSCYYLKNNEINKAKLLTDHCDKILRATGASYYLHINTLLEISSIYRVGLMVKIMGSQISGDPIPDHVKRNYCVDLPKSVWHESSRIHPAHAKHSVMADRFRKMCGD